MNIRHGFLHLKQLIVPLILYIRMKANITSKFAIGQRAILLLTPHGNVLWDCITYLDQETVDKVISHTFRKLMPPR